MNNIEELIEENALRNKVETEEHEQGVIVVITKENDNRTFWIKGTLRGQKIIALVDSGATHENSLEDI